jgi:hypothetical protein
MEQKHSILCEQNTSIMQEIKILKLAILSFSIPERILPSKEHTISQQFVMCGNNQRHGKPFLRLKVGHNINITKETFCGEGVNKVVTAHLL